MQQSLISKRTLEHYNRQAQLFWEGTRDHDVSQNRSTLLKYLNGKPPFHILDLGCGPGRDLLAFREVGHIPIGLDGSSEFVEMARKHSGCEVWQQDFLALSLPKAKFDGIFANASLFHIPKTELPSVLKQLHHCLKTDGVLFSSNPRSNNQEGWQGERFGSYHDWPQWQQLLTAAGFLELEHYYRPSGLPLEQQPWLASVWRKITDE